MKYFVIGGIFGVVISLVMFQLLTKDLPLRKEVIIYYPARSYQIETYNDSTVIYDGNRKVGVIPYNKNSSLDSIINADNL